MAWIFVDKDGDEGAGMMRSRMRRNMKGGYYHHIDGGGSEYERGYRHGYKHGWEDSDDDEMDGYRRGRDSRGRYI